jgi:hypothetical protein
MLLKFKFVFNSVFKLKLYNLAQFKVLLIGIILIKLFKVCLLIISVVIAL